MATERDVTDFVSSKAVVIYSRFGVISRQRILMTHIIQPGGQNGTVRDNEVICTIETLVAGLSRQHAHHGNTGGD